MGQLCRPGSAILICASVFNILRCPLVTFLTNANVRNLRVEEERENTRERRRKREIEFALTERNKRRLNQHIESPNPGEAVTPRVPNLDMNQETLDNIAVIDIEQVAFHENEIGETL